MILPTSPSPTDLTAFFGLFLMMAVWNNTYDWLSKFVRITIKNSCPVSMALPGGRTHLPWCRSCWWIRTQTWRWTTSQCRSPTGRKSTPPLPTCRLAKIRGIFEQKSEYTCDELGLDNLLRFTLVAITSFAGSSSSFTWSTGISGGIFTTPLIFLSLGSLWLRPPCHHLTTYYVCLKLEKTFYSKCHQFCLIILCCCLPCWTVWCAKNRNNYFSAQ